jgi:hypothetical protein
MTKNAPGKTDKNLSKIASSLSEKLAKAIRFGTVFDNVYI